MKLPKKNKLLQKKLDYLRQFGEFSWHPIKLGLNFTIKKEKGGKVFYLSESMFFNNNVCDYDETNGIPYNCKEIPPMGFKEFKAIIDIYVKGVKKT
jgi:hypothetical protein